MNKEYIHDGDIECRRSGYHYFENLAYALTLYNISQIIPSPLIAVIFIPNTLIPFFILYHS